MINILLKNFLDWIYPEKCYICHRISNRETICQTCCDAIELNFPEQVKEINGIKIYSASKYVDNLRKLIKGLKYHNKKRAAKVLAEILYRFWQKLDFKHENFVIIPVPLYPAKKRSRGYNHTLLIAQEFAKLTGYSVNDNLVKRIKNTKPQYKLSKVERTDNLKDAFSINYETYNGEKLLLFDDICTSGSTLEELIKTLKKKGITAIYALVEASNAVMW